eukprot:TRINITY_DN20369_c1_g3_i3.p1 TRINITY_DN20369_c1_g3~~TRINITY_DN20369_c1_g3_i3.p1  ORF type:complete len:236 (-),score=7.37 TRINITY_DN20369_c1_g3_i3:515-1222(-)
MMRETMFLKCCFLLICIFPEELLGCGSGRECCPPPGFDSLQDFSLDDLVKYISAPWYSQYQVPSPRVPANQLYCTTATYVPLDPSDPSKGVRVINYANLDKVNGVPISTSGVGNSFRQLIGIIPDSSQPSKLRVGFPGMRELQQEFYTDYWIVAVQPSKNETIGYDWAIISLGPPNEQTEDGCKVGLYFFTREKVASEDTISTMCKTAQDLGFDTTVLKKVEQEGCLYTDSDLGV